MDVLILALATWRASSLLANEDGPFGMFEHLRLAVGAYYDEYGQRLGGNTLSTGMLCVWCSSVWIGAFWAALYLLIGEVWPALPFALSAAAILVEELLERLRGDDGDYVTTAAPPTWRGWETTGLDLQEHQTDPTRITTYGKG
jgi:hypothetical protein